MKSVLGLRKLGDEIHQWRIGIFHRFHLLLKTAHDARDISLGGFAPLIRCLAVGRESLHRIARDDLCPLKQALNRIQPLTRSRQFRRKCEGEGLKPINRGIVEILRPAALRPRAGTGNPVKSFGHALTSASWSAPSFQAP